MSLHNVYARERETGKSRKPIKGLNIEMTADEYQKKRRAVSKSEDTSIRRELHKQIKELARQGKSVVEIVRTLNTMSEYSEFEPYFVGYAEDCINKMPKFRSQKANEENDSDGR